MKKKKADNPAPRYARLMIQVPHATKAKLDALTSQGYSITGFVRAAIDQALEHGVSKSTSKS